MPPNTLYSVNFHGAAAKQIEQLQPAQFSRIAERIDTLANNPRPPGVIKLSGQDGYRLRVGDYRILYTIDDVAKQVTIYRVKHRRDVYR